MWTWSRQSAEIQLEYQDMEESWFKWLWMCCGCWCQVGWSDLLEFPLPTISRVYWEWSEKQKIPAVVWPVALTGCFCPEENKQNWGKKKKKIPRGNRSRCIHCPRFKVTRLVLLIWDFLVWTNPHSLLLLTTFTPLSREVKILTPKVSGDLRRGLYPTVREKL